MYHTARHHFSYRKWEDCPRCGWTYPKQELRRDCTGLKVCPKCWDAKGFDDVKADYQLRVEEFDENDSWEDVL